jgi:hypothetical protein
MNEFFQQIPLLFLSCVLKVMQQFFHTGQFERVDTSVTAERLHNDGEPIRSGEMKIVLLLERNGRSGRADSALMQHLFHNPLVPNRFGLIALHARNAELGTELSADLNGILTWSYQSNDRMRLQNMLDMCPDGVHRFEMINVSNLIKISFKPFGMM